MPQLQWLNKEADIQATRTVPYRLFEDVPELSYGAANTGNMLIHGNNLDALKALLPYYAGKVKCIFIDPPFNTGGAFENYDDNLEHSTWLSLLYQRLELLRELLAENGALVVNLDDSEAAYAKVLLDEIFGRNSYICTVTVEAATPSSFKTVNVGPTETSQFLLLYCRNKDKFRYEVQFRYSREVDLQHFSRFVENIDDVVDKWRFKNIRQHILDTLGVAEGNVNSRYRLAKAVLGPTYKQQIDEKANKFALENATRVFETKTLQKPSAWLRPEIERSKGSDVPIRLKRNSAADLILLNGRQMYFLAGNVANIEGENLIKKPITTIWDDIPTNNLQREGGVDFPSGKKPEELIKRVIEMTGTKEGEIVLDSFLGSGTTAAVAHKMNRRYIGIELGEQATTHCYPRLRSVVDGEDTGISDAVGWKGGGGFRFYRLGAPVFEANGRLSPEIPFSVLAAHIWFSETGQPWEPKQGTPVLGVHDNRGFALLYNGILGDRTASGGNVLARSTLVTIREKLGAFPGPLTIYGERTALGAATLKREAITFKQTPYDVKVRL